METLYRKVQFEINDKDHDEIWLIGKSANFIFNPNTRNGEELSDFLSGCKTIESEKESNLEKLKADKEELLEALKKAQNELSQFKSAFGQGSELIHEIDSLIQKHKQ